MRSITVIVVTYVFSFSCFQPKSLSNNQRGDESIRILCYNIRNGNGMDDKLDYDRTAGVINKAQPDLVALQELDSATQRSKGVDVLKVLAEKTGMKPTYGAAIDYQGGKYGVGILSKERPLTYSTIALPGSEERRVLLIAEFQNYVLFCTHFSLTEADRIKSAKIINEQRRRFNKKIFLAGDLNDTPNSAAMSTIKQDWELLSGESFTSPAAKPEKCIDYIFASKPHPYTVIRKQVMSEPVASDHLPVFVEVGM